VRGRKRAMTESEWVACGDMKKMPGFLRGKVSDRKLRLFACSCVRRPWWVLDDEFSRHAVEIAERYADGQVTAEELSRAHEQLDLDRGWEIWPAEAVTRSRFGPNEAAWAVDSVNLAVPPGTRCDLLRDLFGPLPFRNVPLDPAWLAWNDGTIVKLAASIYEGRAFEQMLILADALEEAGCGNEEMLTHCGQEGLLHVRGCWLLDLLLQKG
jgi:hypothetical protein